MLCGEKMGEPPSNRHVNSESPVGWKHDSSYLKRVKLYTKQGQVTWTAVYLLSPISSTVLYTRLDNYSKKHLARAYWLLGSTRWISWYPFDNITLFPLTSPASHRSTLRSCGSTQKFHTGVRSCNLSSCVWITSAEYPPGPSVLLQWQNFLLKRMNGGLVFEWVYVSVLTTHLCLTLRLIPWHSTLWNTGKQKPLRFTFHYLWINNWMCVCYFPWCKEASDCLL